MKKLPGSRFAPKILLSFCSLTLGLLFLEGYLHWRNGTAKAERLESVSFYSRGGEKVGISRGPVKLTLAPFTIYKNSPNQRSKTFTINSVGFRGSETAPTAGRRIRVIVTGGSAAFGLRLENDRGTFEAILEELSDRYEIINGGVIGFCSGQELTYLVTELVDYRPRLVIAYNGWNELYCSGWNSRFPGSLGGPGYNSDVFSSLEAQLIDHHRAQESLSRSFRQFIGVLSRKSALLSAFPRGVSRPRSPSPRFLKKGLSPEQIAGFEKIVQTYANNMKKMRDFCASQSIEFLVVLQPEIGLKLHKSPEEEAFLQKHSSDPYGRELGPFYGEFLERSKEVFAREGIRFIDIGAHPRFTQEKGTVFFDRVHTNRLGNEIVARVLQDYLDRWEGL